MSRRTWHAIAAGLLVGACTDRPPLAPIALSAGKFPAAAPREAESGRYLVGFDGVASISADVLATSGGRVVDSLPELNVLVVDDVTNPDGLRAAGPKYIEAGFDMSVTPIVSQDPVAGEDENFAVPGAETTPWFASGVQWDMKAMKADDGWALTSGGEGINVCIVDTGIDDQHQELAGKVVLR